MYSYGYYGFSPLSLIPGWLKFIFVVGIIASIAADWKIFEKAGIEGWKSLIPFYNGYLLFQIAWEGKGWMYFLSLLPIVGVGVTYVMLYKLVIKYGKDDTFFVGMIILPFIFKLILAFDVVGIEIKTTKDINAGKEE